MSTPEQTAPWGAPIAYDGRATLQAAGHTVAVRVYDPSPTGSQTPAPPMGRYPTVYISAVIVERGAAGIEVRGQGDIEVIAGTAPAVPDPTAIPRAVAEAVADFDRRVAAYAALAALWPPAGP
ncbi:ATP-binding protein [Kitasatospora sp. NPDC056181]|uniref:ATP-binding protein n=1 Tax=Kitasatospora sp. NPDC056181 TaxID=3345737 RepID=UPI0035E107F6